jgi:hypothetical protein
VATVELFMQALSKADPRKYPPPTAERQREPEPIDERGNVLPADSIVRFIIMADRRRRGHEL